MNQKKLPQLNCSNSQINTGVIQKTFINDTSDRRISKILCEHGWKERPANSQIHNYQLKWTWKVCKKDYEQLQDDINKDQSKKPKSKQYINHFKNSQEITTKLGLLNIFKKNSFIDDNGQNFCNFYPRSYNLFTEQEEFRADFIKTGILNLLKKIVACLQIYYPEQYDSLTQLSQTVQIKDSHIYLKKLLEKHKIFSKKRCPKSHKNQTTFMVNGDIFIKLLVFLQNMISLDSNYELLINQQLELVQYNKVDIPYVQRKESKSFEYSLQDHTAFMTHKQLNNSDYKTSSSMVQAPSTRALLLLLYYHKKLLNQQNKNMFYSDGFSNIWIVKSNHASRGRNIDIIDDLKLIQKCSNGMKIVQKYIENIWILPQSEEYTKTESQKTSDTHQSKNSPYTQQISGNIWKIIGKKFDIRLWVFVKSFSPLIMYVYEEGYLRISSQDYQLDQLHKSTVHLTNYSINRQKKCHKKQANKKSEKKDEDQSYVLLSEFMEYVQLKYGCDTSKLMSKIRKIIVDTLKCVEISNNGVYNNDSKNCFQLFGFDFLLDGQFQPWLLECNMSPSCSERGQLAKIYEQMIKGMFSLLGLINEKQYHWNQLYNDEKNTIKSTFQINQNYMRQTKISDFNAFRTTKQQFKQKDFCIHGSKISMKSYMALEIYQYAVEKIILIQRFVRKKLNFPKFNNIKLARLTIATQFTSKKFINTSFITSEANKKNNNFSDKKLNIGPKLQRITSFQAHLITNVRERKQKLTKYRLHKLTVRKRLRKSQNI